MPTYKTPGVFVEEISTFPPSVAQVATAIPAFIGFTENGADVRNKPTRILSLLDYEQQFGTAQPQTNITVNLRQTKDAGGNIVQQSITAGLTPANRSKFMMYYSLQAYFANGGGPCYIVSVGDYNAAPSLNPLNDGLTAIENEDEPTLIVFPDQQALSLADQATLVNSALKQCADLQDRFVIANFHETGENLKLNQVDAKAGEFRTPIGSVADHRRYGAGYLPNLNTTFDYRYNDADVTIDHKVKVGDAAPIDGDHQGADIGSVKTTPLYTPITQAIGALPVVIPPCGAVAGVYARVDEARGVWKAPANEGLIGVSGLTLNLNDEVQENLNVDGNAGKSLNAIRAFTGRGIIVWGSRTLDGNSNEWRYVPVRRFFNMVEESTKKSTRRFVFEPNDANTWVKVRAMIENFLLLQWRAGALQGAKPEQAFFVRVGLGETMSPQDILEGRMIVEIGMAVVRPAEFIILRFSHKMPEG